MEGRDVVATAQTGTGKILAFSIPVIEALAAVPRTKTIKVLILSPTRELAIQIDAAFRELTQTTGDRSDSIPLAPMFANAIKRCGGNCWVIAPGTSKDLADSR